MGTSTMLSRRDFLRFSGLSLGAFLLPSQALEWVKPLPGWPALRLEALPPRVFEILSLAPRVQVSQDGYLLLSGRDGRILGPVAQAYTQWNREHQHSFDRLRRNLPWAIVLHWYGDNDHFDRTLAGYLRGFDSLRRFKEYETRTSAHFLVGPERPSVLARMDAPVGIIQTQMPAADGVPFLASHLQNIDLKLHLARRQYFVRALYQLGFSDPALLGDRKRAGIVSLLQDFFDGRYLDQNKRTLAVEITGFDFENPTHFPPPQQIANVLSLVWALMKRYRVRAVDVLGHMEIQLNKADPGKKFMALIRQLLGLKALIEDDEEMRGLVFGQFLGPEGDAAQAVRRYFKFVRDYLMLVSVPRTVFEWETACNYWLCQQLITGTPFSLPLTPGFRPPVDGDLLSPGRIFLDPQNHEGVDLYQANYLRMAYTAGGRPVYLAAPGVCLYAGEAFTCTYGRAAIFRHLTPDGGELLSVYGHLESLGDLRVGEIYPGEYRFGETMGYVPQDSRFLHFALAYGTTWDTYLNKHARLPQNIGPKWITERYLSPDELISRRREAKESRLAFE